jgi:hypothetical protein
MLLILDCERMKYPHTGLFEYCEQLGKTIQKCATEEDKITYYVPKKYEKYFGNYNSILQKSVHKLFPVKIKQRAVLHTTYQLSRYVKWGGEL